MLGFDLLLLFVVSVALAEKSFYLGSTALIIGLLIHYQCVRIRSLLGKEPSPLTVGRKVKAAILALVLGLSASPFLFEGNKIEKEENKQNLIPLTIVISLFSATMMSALVVERRRR